MAEVPRGWKQVGGDIIFELIAVKFSELKT